MKRLLLLVLVLAIPSLSTAAVTNSFWNVNTSNLVVKAINLNGSNITDWSQIGGGGSGSITNIAAGYGISISSGYGPEATVTVDTNIIASQSWVTGQWWANAATGTVANALYSTSSGIASNLHSGSATTGQVATANGSGGTFWATPAAGGGITNGQSNVEVSGRFYRDPVYASTNDIYGMSDYFTNSTLDASWFIINKGSWTIGLTNGCLRWLSPTEGNSDLHIVGKMIPAAITNGPWQATVFLKSITPSAGASARLDSQFFVAEATNGIWRGLATYRCLSSSDTIPYFWRAFWSTPTSGAEQTDTQITGTSIRMSFHGGTKEAWQIEFTGTSLVTRVGSWVPGGMPIWRTKSTQTKTNYTTCPVAIGISCNDNGNAGGGMEIGPFIFEAP